MKNVDAVCRERISLPTMSPGTERYIEVLRIGSRGSRPKAYLQASLHADEIPAMLVLNHLVERLRQAADAGLMIGEVVVVPAANPVGLSQIVHGRSLGRHALSGSGNFNRDFPNLIDRIVDDVTGKLGSDASQNVAIVRTAFAEALNAITPTDEVAYLRRALLQLSCGVDIALDLHSDSDGAMHLFVGTPLWPEAADLSAQIGSVATLLATESGGNPFDEALGGIWWTLAKRYPEFPVPLACLSATIEYRGRSDVSETLAATDADNLFQFLQRRGLIGGDPGPLPEALCEATPLEGVDMIRSPVAGIVAYEKNPGERVSTGDVVAIVIDPLAKGFASARTKLRARCDGVLYGRTQDRLTRPGMLVCRVAGSEAFPERKGGNLLTD